MKDYYKDAGEKVAVFAIFPIVIGLFFFILGKKFSDLFSWLLQKLRKDQGTVSCQESDMMEIKKTSLQIAHGWLEMMTLIKGIQDSQKHFVDRLQKHIETTIETLGQNITVSLEDEFLRNDQRFGKMRRTMEAMQEDILSMKIFLQTFYKNTLKLSEKAEVEKKGMCIDNFAQTEYEIKKRVKDSHTKIVNDTEISKLMNIVKKCLADLMKDTKLQLSIDQDEENRELQVVLSKLAEDREDIKKTIIQAFSIAAEQAKRNFDQFGHIGHDAMNYIAVLNENTNKMLKIKLEKVDNRLKDVLSAVDRQNSDVDRIGETLQKIDDQFDQIFQRVELGCQRNTEHCGELAESLEKTSSNWVVTAAELEKVTRNLSNDVKQMKESLKELIISFDCLKPEYINEEDRDKKDITYFDSIASESTQDLQMLSQKQKNKMLIFARIQNMTSINSRVENGCENLCNHIEVLKCKLTSLNESVSRLDQVIQSVNLENFFTSVQCKDANSDEIIESVLRWNIGNAGDGQQQIPENLRNSLINDNLQKVRLVMEQEVTIIEHVLMKVCEKLNSWKMGVPYDSTLAANITEGSRISHTIEYDGHN